MHVSVISSTVCLCVGVLYNRVPEDEWYVLGTDCDGPDEAAGPHEQGGGPAVYPAVPA